MDRSGCHAGSTASIHRRHTFAALRLDTLRLVEPVAQHQGLYSAAAFGMLSASQHPPAHSRSMTQPSSPNLFSLPITAACVPHCTPMVDTGSTQGHWPFPCDKVATGYAYILTHPGIPCLFWEHLFDNCDALRDDIRRLVEIRRRNGISARASLDILCADGDLYVARIDDKLTLKLGPRYDLGSPVPRDEDGWRMVACGVEYAVWERA